MCVTEQTKMLLWVTIFFKGKPNLRPSQAIKVIKGATAQFTKEERGLSRDWESAKKHKKDTQGWLGEISVHAASAEYSPERLEVWKLQY